MPSLSHKDWIRAAVAHRETGAVPYNFMFVPPVTRALCKHYGVADLYAHLGMPIRTNAPWSPKPLYATPEQFGETVTDEFGVVWSTNDVDRGAPLKYSLPEADLVDYPWPDPRLPRRFEGLADWCAATSPIYYTGLRPV